jgi:hypothetical protein
LSIAIFVMFGSYLYLFSAVNMVRPMKYGFVVGNPVVSLNRLRRNILPPVPLEIVAEDEDEEDEEEDVNLTTVEIAPTPSGLPSPSSPEAASTSATPEQTTQTSPFSTPRSPHQRNSSSITRTRFPRDNLQVFDQSDLCLPDLSSDQGISLGYRQILPFK